MPETITEELTRLKARIAKLEEEAMGYSNEVREYMEHDKEVTSREDRVDKEEDEIYREQDRLRAKARRRDRAAFEKLTHNTRIQAVKALASMMPAAKAQAKKGKPALLRLILRATR